jgi:pantetheine-phosphate adenylyltransferase
MNKFFYTLTEAAERLKISPTNMRLVAVLCNVMEFGSFTERRYRKDNIDKLAAHPESYCDLLKPTEETEKANDSEGVVKKRALYMGSFDPITHGHFWVIETFAPLFDEFVVGVGQNPQKKNSYTFTAEERIGMIKELTDKLKNVTVVNAGKKLTSHLAKALNCNFLVQGIRNLDDYEKQKAARYANADMAPGIETLLVIPPRELNEVSSSFVKGLVGYDDWEMEVPRWIDSSIYHKLKKLDEKKEY